MNFSLFEFGDGTIGTILSNTFKGMLGCGMLAAIFVAVSIFLGIMTFNNFINSILGIFNPDVSAKVQSTRTVVQSVQPLGQLVSVEIQVAKADIRVSVRSGVANACGRSASHVASAAISAGINLKSLTEDDIIYDALDDSYTIMLPAPQLTSCRIDFIDQYDRSTSTCGPNWDDIRQLAQYESMIEFRDDTIEGDILGRAQDEAELTLSNFLFLATGSNIKLDFRDSGEIIFPSSCQPIAPAGWEYDQEDDEWKKP